MTLLPIVVAAAFQFGGSVAAADGTPQVVSLATSGSFNFALFVLLVSTGFLLVVIVALFAGDTVASEASWSSLRYLLAQPVPRARLLRQKIVVATGIFASVVVLYTAWTLLVGGVFFGFHTTKLPIGEPVGSWEATGQVAVIVGYICIQLAGTAAFAFFFSTCFDDPLGAVGGAVMLTVVSSIFDQISALGALRNIFIGHWDYAWFDALGSPIRYDEMVRGIGVSLVYVAVFSGRRS